MGWSGLASIGYYAVGNFYQNHPLANSATANTIACVNSPTSVWSNVVYQLTFIHPGNVIHTTVIYHTVVHEELKLCVEWGSTNTGWHIVCYDTYMKCEVRTQWDMGIWGIHGLNGWGIHGLNGWGIHGLNGWGIYKLDGWGTYGEVSYRYRFVGRYSQKTLVFKEVLSGHCMSLKGSKLRR